MTRSDRIIYKITSGTIRILLIIGMFYALHIYSNNKRIEAIRAEYEKMPEDEAYLYNRKFRARLENTPSDIEGLSQADKTEMGLLYMNGSDTDRDGLTDKEELEVYHSNPLKTSTAGDLYTDSYKAENNMDFNKKEKFKGDFVFAYNSTPEITLTASVAEDYLASTEAIAVMHHANGYETLKEYRITEYEGDILIDTNMIAELKDIPAKNLKVFHTTYDCPITDKVKIKNKGKGILQAKTKIEGRSTMHFVMIAKKSEDRGKFAGAVDFLRNGISGIETILEEERKAVQGTGLVVNLPFANLFACPQIYYVSSGDAETDELIKERLVECATMIEEPFLGERDYAESHGIGVFANTSDCREVTVAELETIRAFWRMLWPAYELDPESYCDLYSEGEFLNYTFTPDYFSYADMNEYFRKKALAETHFNMFEDALPFQNITSFYTGKGSCAGFSLYTARMFNKGVVPESGEYTLPSDDVYNLQYLMNTVSDLQYNEDGTITVSWNIAKDEENATLLDPILSDYKNKKFKPDLRNGYDTYSDGEKEFVKMITGYWLEENQSNELNTYSVEIEEYDAANLEKIKAYLDTGRIAIVDVAEDSDQKWHDAVVSMNEEGEEEVVEEGYLEYFTNGHSMNIIAYKEISDEETWFYIYDCNIGPSHYAGGNYYGFNNVMKIYTPVVHGVQRFIFSYWPTTGTYASTGDKKVDYGYENNRAYYAFAVFDDDLNEITKDYVIPESVNDIYDNVEAEQENTENEEATE